jgi:hypothetical protein
MNKSRYYDSRNLYFREGQVKRIEYPTRVTKNWDSHPSFGDSLYNNQDIEFMAKDSSPVEMGCTEKVQNAVQRGDDMLSHYHHIGSETEDREAQC